MAEGALGTGDWALVEGPSLALRAPWPLRALRALMGWPLMVGCVSVAGIGFVDLSRTQGRTARRAVPPGGWVVGVEVGVEEGLLGRCEGREGGRDLGRLGMGCGRRHVRVLYG